MGKRMPPKREAEGSPKKKSLRLDLQRQALAAAEAPEVRDPMEEGAEGTGDSSRCDHRVTDSARNTLMSSLLSADAGKCVDCRLEDEKGAVKHRPEKSSILMCLQCGQHFCCGVLGIVYPFGHSRTHALKKQHWVAALYGDATRGYCFKCSSEVEMPAELKLASGVKPRRAGTGIDKRCNHVPRNRVHKEILSLSLWKCDHCGCMEGSIKILVCLGCDWKFCTEHAPGHAKHKQHWFAVLLKSPEVGVCFKCEAVVDVNSGKIQAESRASGSGAVPGPARDFGSVVPGMRGDTRPMVDDTMDFELVDKCNHLPSDSAYKVIMGSPLLVGSAGTKCESCKSKDSPVGISILVCLECGRKSCGDESLVPYGHARDHAKQEQHWASVLSDNLQIGFCYKCEISVLMYSDSDSDSDVEKEVTDRIQPGGHAFGSDLAPVPVIVSTNDKEFGSTNVQGYAIKGIPNRGSTCYVSAIVQCLLVLDKLQARMLGPDPPPGCLGLALKELFVETSAADAVGGMLNPDELLIRVRFRADKFEANRMHDSHELLEFLYDTLQNEENGIETPYRQTVIDSIFRGEVSDTRSCMYCQSSTVVSDPFYELSMALPSTEVPSRSDASPQTIKSSKSQPKKTATQLLPENEGNSVSVNIEAVAKSVASHLLGSELKDVVAEKTPERLEVDSAEAERIWQINTVPSIENCLSLFFEEDIVERICACSEVPEEPTTSQSENTNLTVTSTNDETTIDGVQTEQSDMTSLPVEYKCSSSREQDSSDAKSEITKTVDINTDRTNSKMSCGDKDLECHDGIQEAVSSLVPAEKQPLSVQHSQILSTPNQDRRNRLVPDLRESQLGDNQNGQKGRSQHAIQKTRITKLPPVLTLHLKRYIQDGKKFQKNETHVRYKEYLDVGKFMDSSSVDRDNSRYRLAGVVEHQGGPSMNSGHYVAYVRARRLGNQQQQSSCSSSWFCADDTTISQVTLEEVLEREAYILFYERMEG